MNHNHAFQTPLHLSFKSTAAIENFREEHAGRVNRFELMKDKNA